MTQAAGCSDATNGSLPILSGIANYIQCHRTLFAIQLGGTVLILALAVRFGRSLRRAITENMLDGKKSGSLSKLLGHLAYYSLLGLALVLIAALWGVNGYQRDLAKQLADQAPGLVRNLGLTLLVLVVALGVGRVIQRTTLGSLRHRKIDVNLSLLVSRFFYLVALGIGVLVILTIWDVQLIIPVTVLGAMTLAISFSIQDILKNLVAGVYILVERPFRIGDQIVVDKYLGLVEDIQMRVTTLRTTTGEQVLIPNAIIFGSPVVNNTAYHRRRAMMTVALPESEMKVEEAEKILLEALKSVEGILSDPPPTIAVSSVAEQKLTLDVHFWVPTDRLDLLSTALFHVKRALPSAEVSVPGVIGMV
ncbi:MAG TPA: mechanosensitive ion channel family protein [Ktedonobacterales bacterium]